MIPISKHNQCPSSLQRLSSDKLFQLSAESQPANPDFFAVFAHQYGQAELSIALQHLNQLSSAARAALPLLIQADNEYNQAIITGIHHLISTVNADDKASLFLRLVKASQSGQFSSIATGQMTQSIQRLNQDGKLQGLNLRGMDFSQLDLSRLDLSFSHLSKAMLNQTNCQHTVLTRVNLIGAQLNGANLSHATLFRARLINAELNDADLSGTDLVDANLCGAILHRANLQDACLTGADMTITELCHANLHNANLSGVNLTEANLSNAIMTDAVLVGTEISGTLFRGAINLNMTGTNNKNEAILG